jgi:hypothetical protein
VFGDGRATNLLFFQLEPMSVKSFDRIQDPHGFGRDFRSDPIARQ